MDTLYPKLHDRFKTEGLCPICLMEMELTPRYSCTNGHTVCYRCKPYYYSCPTCTAPLDVQILPPQPSPMVQLPPCPMLRRGHDDHNPSAPPVDDFLNHERRAWQPPVPPENQPLESCSYSHLGCWVKIPEHLRVLHESRCQFRPRSEEEHVSTNPSDDLVGCSYFAAGCRARVVSWQRAMHERDCIYRFQGVNDISDGLASATIADNDYGGDPEELVECRFRRYGCMVNMPRRRKYTHEQKCNYKSYQTDVNDGFVGYPTNYPDYPSQPELDPDEQVECRWFEYGCRVKPKRCRKQIHEEKCNYKSYQTNVNDGFVGYPTNYPDYPSQPELDPDEQVECRWFEYGCRVKPKRCRKQIHEDKCNYRMEECMWKHYGCSAIFKPNLKYSHENNCDFAQH
ncbi:uncharacterized protein LOC105832894 [Monomorium pharaonis]|uniref:uncharacterized protein LOC105832894 n=1 Tax=Monomorium pharaonis TaxID=307658 RepID=UPI001747B71A|nr:uncharacterized protein LOC105832894 [Monomorium pharaonis]XP_028047181.2 uncharacterized protein LOC105832894 [Monomorium pharaonis]